VITTQKKTSTLSHFSDVLKFVLSSDKRDSEFREV
jgi:hypothetical protein